MKRKKQIKVAAASLANLSDRSAPDKPGETEATTLRIGVEDLKWLRSLPEGISYHVRQAVQQYRKTVEQKD